MISKILLIVPLFFSIHSISCAQSISATAYGDNIWLSKNVFFEGEKIRIYSEFNNPTNYDLEQIIEFYDNNQKIGEKNISIASHKKIITWIDWTFTQGEHKIISQIKESKKDSLSGKIKIDFKKIKNLKKIKVDQDTDQDGIGDLEDQDDDNDGFSDTEEIKSHSDPKLKSSTPLTQHSLTTKKIKQNTKEITSSLAEILQEKRKYFEKQLGQSLEEIKKEKSFLDAKKESDIKALQNKDELALIQKYKKDQNFITESKNKKLILKNINTITDLKKEITKEELFLNSQNLQSKELEFSKACLYQAKYEKINEIIEEQNSENFFSKIWYFILLILWYIFKNTLLTIAFLVILFWLIWKIIKKF